MKKVTQLLLFCLLFLTPFVVFRIGVSSYEGSKVLVTEGILLLLTAITFLSKQSNDIFVLTPFRKVLLVLIGLTILHMLFSRSETTFFGNPFRMQGAFLYLLLFIFAWMTPYLPKLRVHWMVVFGILALHIVIALTQGLTQNGRFVGNVGEANAFGAIAIFLWPWVLFGMQPKRKALQYGWVIGSICLAGTILFLSGSRSALVAFGVQCLFVLLYYVFHVSLKKTVITCLVLMMLSLTLPFFQKNVIYENRVDVWKAALIAGFDKPILGFGVGNVEVALKEYNKKLYNNVQGYYVDSSHNFLLDWWVMGGFVGLSATVLLLYMTFKRYIQEGAVLSSVLILGMITVMLFNPASITTIIPFWWLIGQAESSS